MKNSLLMLALVMIIAIAFYFLGKKNGSNDVKTDYIQNTDIVKQIAELSALQVDGNITVKVSNLGDNKSIWDKVKNYFAENTLQISIPYQAKYGVDINDQKISITANDSIANIHFPACKLLSLQLQLDKVNTMSKTGLFNSISLEEYVAVQKQLYEQCNRQLMTNAENIQSAENNIQTIIQKYYTPLHLRVKSVFLAK